MQGTPTAAKVPAEGKLVQDFVRNWPHLLQQREIRLFFFFCAPRRNTKNNEDYSLGARLHFNIRKNFLMIMSVIKSSSLAYKQVRIAGGFKTKALEFSLIQKMPLMCLPAQASYLGMRQRESAGGGRAGRRGCEPLHLGPSVITQTLEGSLERGIV